MVETLEAFEETGYNGAIGEGMKELMVAATLLHILSLPADANIDLLEIRSRH